MNIQTIINSIRIGNEHMPDYIRTVLEHELPIANDAYRQLLADGADEDEARAVSLSCALMHILGMESSDEENHS